VRPFERCFSRRLVRFAGSDWGTVSSLDDASSGSYSSLEAFEIFACAFILETFTGASGGTGAGTSGDSSCPGRSAKVFAFVSLDAGPVANLVSPVTLQALLASSQHRMMAYY
jgi:hypothetical protein